jgi:hypothetical protein
MASIPIIYISLFLHLSQFCAVFYMSGGGYVCASRGGWGGEQWGVRGWSICSYIVLNGWLVINCLDPADQLQEEYGQNHCSAQVQCSYCSEAVCVGVFYKWLQNIYYILLKMKIKVFFSKCMQCGQIKTGKAIIILATFTFTSDLMFSRPLSSGCSHSFPTWQPFCGQWKALAWFGCWNMKIFR